MGFLDKLFGRREEPPRRHPYYQGEEPPRRHPYYQEDYGRGPATPSTSDEAALQRYRYMMRTAPPETIEQAHEEAFSKLTPEQRRQVLRDLGEATPPAERAALATGDDPKTLARLATRAEMRQPGITERLFGGPGMGYGTMMAGTIFGSLVAGFVGSMIANQFFDSIGNPDLSQGDWGDHGGGWSDQGAQGASGDFIDSGGADFGGDFGGGMDI
jgi:hypothetical protein